MKERKEELTNLDILEKYNNNITVEQEESKEKKEKKEYHEKTNLDILEELNRKK